MALLVFLLSMMPPNLPGLAVFHNDVVHSLTFAAVSAPLKKRLPFIEKIQKHPQGLTLTLPSPEGPAPLETSAAYQELMKDERVKALFSDEETLQQIREQDLPGLFNNPRVFAVMQDRELVAQFFKLYGDMMQDKDAADETAPAAP